MIVSRRGGYDGRKEFSMVVEYQIQMLVNGEWVRALYPTGQVWRAANNPTESETAEQGIGRLREHWAKQTFQPKSKVPTDFRVVYRMVSSWQPLDDIYE